MTFYAGYDIGGTNARISIFDEEWKTVRRQKREIREATRPEEVATVMREMLEDSMANENVTGIEAVGVGLAGQLTPDGSVVVNAPNLGWRDEPFARRLHEAFNESVGGAEIRVVNDLSALLWGEYVQGAVGGAEEVLAVYVGTGIGGAVMASGQLLHGGGGNAGEIGHSKVEPGGRLCGCGERGCVEAYAGGVHLERQAAHLAREHGISEIFNDDEFSSVDLGVVDAMTGEAPEFDELWERASDYLAIVAANACTLLDPEVLLLGGGVLEHCDDFRSRLLTKVPPLILKVIRESMEIQMAEHSDTAGMLGAATLAAGEERRLFVDE